MDRTLCFSKTTAGLAEIQERTRGLPLKLRQMLIMVDGSKTIADLEQFLPVSELETRLTALHEQGLIELNGHAGIPASTPAAAAPPAQATAPTATDTAGIVRPAGLPSAGSLAQTRLILAMCSQQYLDDALDTMLIDLFDNLSGPDDLKFCIDTWYKRMQAAGFGHIADSHLPQIRAMLR
ncbi:hypothetical protein [Chitinilyticum litopenaei]|uniref:hypothetical protein n=1 Tax=Chitinilyticum litopenaei TaxID=1121276 RepID=UPI0004085EB8|nr:hypothetical protein [Chitinilyticum litopenaei]